MNPGIGVRIFFLHDDGTIKRVSQRRFEAFHDENEMFPEYAGKNLRCAYVIVELKNRKPVHIRAIDPIRLYFEANGSCNQVMRKRKQVLADKKFQRLARTGNSDIVIDLQSYSAEKLLEKDYRWQPTVNEIRKISALLKIL
ncbi:MAG: hypothetical protein ACC635_01910 [Acidiferrobacterales bacterium]